MVLVRLIATVVALSTFASTSVTLAETYDQDALPRCEFDTEIQFYNLEISLLDLPDLCTDDLHHMNTIGVFIQDVVDEVEDRMPEYKEERSVTLVCPFAEEVKGQHRVLKESSFRPAGERNLATTSTTTTTNKRRRRYKFRAAGRCRRCKEKTTARRRVEEEESNDVCAIAAEISILRDRAVYFASTCHSVLQSMKAKDFENGSFFLRQAEESAVKCQEESHIASRAATAAMELCEKASSLRSFKDVTCANVELDTAKLAVNRVKDALATVRRANLDFNTMHYVERVQNHRHLKIQDRKLSEKEQICNFADIAEDQYMLAKDACDVSADIVDSMKDIAKNVDNKAAWKLWDDADTRLEKCEDERDDAEDAKDAVATLCKKGDKKKVDKAESELEDATKAAEKAVDYLSEIQDYKIELVDLDRGPSSATEPPTSPPPTTKPPTQRPPTPKPPTSRPPTPNPPTQRPPTSKPPTRIPPTPYVQMAGKQIARSHEEYLDRLSANLDNSNTSCEQVKRAMIQKTLAEETVVASDKAYDELMYLALDFERNADVQRIKDKAQQTHERVEAEALKACAAADLASELCSKQARARSRSRRLVRDSLKKEVEIAAEAVVESRLALSQERSALEEMEEVIALIEFDPTMSDLEITLEEDEKVLVKHLGLVETEIDRVDTQIQELPNKAPKTLALETKKDSLLDEEHQVEEVLKTRDHFLISESALKKDEYYSSVGPDFEAFPPLQYILRSRQDGEDLTVEANWDAADEVADSKESWFRRFGDALVADIPAWLVQVYSVPAGGCIPDGATFTVEMVVTELETVWEKLNQDDCLGANDIQKPIEKPNKKPSCPATTSGPAPIGGKAIWSSNSRPSYETPYYRNFDGITNTFESNTLQGAESIEKYLFAYGASSQVCYDQMFLGVTRNYKISGTRWNGSAWESISMDKQGVMLGSISNDEWNNIVGAYESQSGRAMVVFHKGSGGTWKLRYSVWDGETNGNWPDSMQLDPMYVGDNPMWFDIASNPLSNEIVVVFTDERKTIYAAVWDGMSWTPTLDIAHTLHQSGIAVSYEARSGRAMLLYGKAKGEDNSDGMFYSIWDGSTWIDEQIAFILPASEGLTVNWLELRSDPLSNRLVAGAIADKGCLLLSIWNGSGWEASEEASCELSDTESPCASVAFESRSQDAVAVWGEAKDNNVYYKTLKSGSTTWSTKQIAGTTQGTPLTVALYSNPDLGSDQIMLMVMNEQKTLFAAPWYGSKFGSFTKLEDNVGEEAKKPYSFLWNQDSS